MVNIICGLASLVVGVIFLFELGNLSLGSLGNPGSGLFPFIVGIMSSFLSLVLIVIGFKRKEGRINKNNLVVPVKPLLGMLVLIIFLIVWKWMDYFLACAILLLLWMRFIGKEKWGISIISAVIVMAVFYSIFVVGLDVPLLI